MNALDLIRAQHAELDLLLLAARDADGDSRADLLRAIGDRFEAHAIMEEKIFYPLFATGDARTVLSHYAEEHQEVRRALAALVGRPDLATTAQIDALRREIRSHAIDQEEAHLLPLVEKTLTAAQLDQLGADMEALHDELRLRGEWRALDADSHHATL